MNYYIYTDGSAIGNNNVTKETPAGWGFVVIQGDPGSQHNEGTEVTRQSGRVITHPSNPLFIGAEVGSNNTGELSAMYHALEWAMLRASVERDMEVTIYSDSNYALNLVFGSWRASTNKQLVSKCINERERAEMALGGPVMWEHIRAHSGYHWNEVADQLAYSAANQ